MERLNGNGNDFCSPAGTSPSLGSALRAVDGEAKGLSGVKHRHRHRRRHRHCHDYDHRHRYCHDYDHRQSGHLGTGLASLLSTTVAPSLFFREANGEASGLRTVILIIRFIRSYCVCV